MSKESAALEAILFSSNRPLKVRELQQATDSDRNALEGALEELRDLITEVGRGSGPGQPKLYGTTMRFLQVMGLESLDHLPTPSDGVELIARQNG